jgi:hypothetical protein
LPWSSMKVNFIIFIIYISFELSLVDLRRSTIALSLDSNLRICGRFLFCCTLCHGA